MSPLHQAKRVCLGLVSFCLSLTFLGALPGGVSPDRAARNAQRSRVSRCPRHRIVAGISQEPVSLRNAFIRTARAADPPPAEMDRFAAPPPATGHIELLVVLAQLHTLAEPQLDDFLARPPPTRIV